MRILVTGAEGQVARCLAEQAVGHDLLFTTYPAFDLADPASIARAVAEAAPDLVISAAAYTAVDRAEDEPDLAMRVNGAGPGALAAAAAKAGAPILHVSTDYVFDGSLARPYREEDPVAPLGAYGASKLAGEVAVAASGARYAILRTAWLYSPFGANFVKTMLRLAADRDEIAVVADQRGCPTSAAGLAEALLAIADAWCADPAHGADRIYHCAGAGETNWADFARAIFEESATRGGPSATVHSIATEDYPTKARRPMNSRLDCTRLTETFGYRPAPWRTSLAGVVDRLLT